MKPDNAGPPMEPNTSEATEKQLDLAREQGAAYGRALTHMTTEVAHDGGEQDAGHYRIGYAPEEAEGMYEWTDGELADANPGPRTCTSRCRFGMRPMVASCPASESSRRSSIPRATRSAPMSSRWSSTR
jgi:hypothetical protein